ncbi:MAG: FkbM family methyltransferase, partial [Roseovarius sp.]|nr:FkbM family methyltransferase [Roseovarius sp.]
GISKIDFLWADVQGAEGDLIEGARETLRKNEYFYTEYSNKELYDGEWSLRKIGKSLPNHELIRVWRQDALFKLK